ncbi:MAG: YraN family protein [Muribaculaceae bacterium]|nr:YraN family protein [Muribaculaceae bacterium]
MGGKKTGDWGENVAVELLIGKGYAICERNWRSGHYEVDIIASKAGRMVFVEVKTRTAGSVDPAEAVDIRKMKRMVYASDVYLRSNDVPFCYQYDIITVTGTPDCFEVEHIEDAFLSPSVMCL